MTQKKKYDNSFRDMATIKLNQLIGNEFAMPKTEIETCHYCDFVGPHIIEHRMVSIDVAIKTYKCTKCNKVWEYVDEELLNSDSRE